MKKISNSDHSEIYKQIALDQMKHCISTQADYGKWMLASLLAVNGGGLIAISQAGGHAPKLFEASGLFLFMGAIFALVGGGLTWLNFTYAASSYLQMVVNSDSIEVKKAQWCARFAITATFLSILSFGIAGYKMLSVTPLLSV